MDWFTIVAQIVNFLILVALLKHFLYGPIIRAMDTREETIRNRLKEADGKRQEAEEKVSTYREKQAELDRQREDILNEAREQAEQERKEKRRQDRAAADDLSRQWLDAVQREKADFLQEIRQTVGRQAVAVAGKLLADLADATLEQQVVAGFIRRLQETGDDQRQALTEALGSDEPLQVRTAFAADDDTRQRITEAVHQQLDKHAQIDFVQDDALVCGVELAGGGSKVAWSLSDYLDDARQEIEQALSQGETKRQEGPQDEGDGETAGQDDEKPEKKASEADAEKTDGKEDHAGKPDA